MSAAIVIAQLSSLVRDLEAMITGLNDVICTNDDFSVLDMLGAKLADAATTVQKTTGSFRPSRKEQAWKASEILRSQAQSTIKSLTNDGKLERPAVFRRNVVMAFAGPKDSDFDSDDARSRKATTRLRCERIRKLSPDGVVVWAASYTPTAWAAGSMGKDIFDCLIDNTEPESAQNWPPVIQETLQKLRTDEALQNSLEYGEFIDAIIDPSRRSQARLGKRRRTDRERQSGKTAEHGMREAQRPTRSTERCHVPDGPVLYNEHREIKYMCTNAPASNVSKLPEPFRTAVQNSRLWKWERSQEPELKTTGCLSTLFPKNNTHDVSVTIFCGNNDGYVLNEFFGLLETSS